MAGLNGKKIKVDGKKYEVKDHFTNRDENLETIVLTRAIKPGKLKPAATINELGYVDESDVVYSDDAMASMYAIIGKSFGKIINITMILNGGVLSDTDLQIVGPNWENPDQVDVIFLDKDSEKAVISKDLLLKSCLLWQERHNQYTPERESSEESGSIGPEDIEEVLGDLTGLLGDLLKNRSSESSGSSGSSGSSKAHDILEQILGDRGRPSQRSSQSSEMPDISDMPDILKDMLGSGRSSRSDRSEEFSIEEMNFDDAPQAIKDIIRNLKNHREP